MKHRENQGSGSISEYKRLLRVRDLYIYTYRNTTTMRLFRVWDLFVYIYIYIYRNRNTYKNMYIYIYIKLLLLSLMLERFLVVEKQKWTHQHMHSRPNQRIPSCPQANHHSRNLATGLGPDTTIQTKMRFAVHTN